MFATAPLTTRAINRTSANITLLSEQLANNTHNSRKFTCIINHPDGTHTHTTYPRTAVKAMQIDINRESQLLSTLEGVLFHAITRKK